jgi:cysteine-rich repeat protein
MKFHQGLAGLLTLLMPVATVCYTNQTEWGVDLTPHQPVSPGKVGDDRGLRDREMAQIQRPTNDRKRVLLTEDDFCDGTPITRTVPCGGEDVLELELKDGTTYTIDVQRVDCGLLDPKSTLFPPGEDPNMYNSEFVADNDDAGFENLPKFCDQTNTSLFYSDPYLQYAVRQTGRFSLLTQSFNYGNLPECPSPINDLELEYRVFICCAKCGDENFPAAGKECEDGNYANNDFCSATCRKSFCGDGAVDDGEECDDGNTESGDGCSAKCQSEAGVAAIQGDPHFKTWRGHRYDFHGECDLLMLHSSAFQSGLGLDIHIRTQMSPRHSDMSYISSAAIRIGTDILEVESQGVYYLNGEYGADLPNKFSGFAFSHTQPTDKQHVFELYLGGRERIKLKTYDDFVSVLIEQGQIEHFGDSVGLMGDFGKGRMLARDGKTVLNNPNDFGQEWQVLATEPSLFQTPFLPQDKQVCRLPPPMKASQLRRRLSSVDELAAEKACEHWGEGKADCVFDVMTTGDLDMAMVGSY